MKNFDEMMSHEQRVVNEHTELLTKTEKLDLFTGSETYHALPDAERKRLDRQLMIMQLYVQVLEERIAAF